MRSVLVLHKKFRVQSRDSLGGLYKVVPDGSVFYFYFILETPDPVLIDVEKGVNNVMKNHLKKKDGWFQTPGDKMLT